MQLSFLIQNRENFTGSKTEDLAVVVFFLFLKKPRREDIDRKPLFPPLFRPIKTPVLSYGSEASPESFRVYPGAWMIGQKCSDFSLLHIFLMTLPFANSLEKSHYRAI